jgi:hypothetical protein
MYFKQVFDTPDVIVVVVGQPNFGQRPAAFGKCVQNGFRIWNVDTRRRASVTVV